MRGEVGGELAFLGWGKEAQGNTEIKSGGLAAEVEWVDEVKTIVSVATVEWRDVKASGEDPCMLMAGAGQKDSTRRR